MKIALINTKDTVRARYLLECFEEGARKHGDQTLWVANPNTYRSLLDQADMGVAVCYPNRYFKGSAQGMFRLRSVDYMRERGRRTLFIDTGFIKNQTEYEIKDGAGNPSGKKEYLLFDINNKATYARVLQDIYYEVGYDGLKRHADYCSDGSDSSRWRQLMSHGVSVAPWRTSGDHILLVGQTFRGLSSQHLKGDGIFSWYADVIKAIRHRTARPIVYRLHPRLTKIRPEQNRVKEDAKKWNQVVGKVDGLHKSKSGLIEEDLKNAWATVVFTSNASVTSVLNGIPVFACDEGCMAWDVANHDIANIEHPQMPDRSRWLNKLAFSQFNCAELRSGVCWSHLRPHALKPPKALSVLDT